MFDTVKDQSTPTFCRVLDKIDVILYQTTHFLDSSKEFAEDNFKFNENWIQFTKQVENTVGKGKHCSPRAISPFPTVFSSDFVLQTCKNQGVIGKGLMGDLRCIMHEEFA